MANDRHTLHSEATTMKRHSTLKDRSLRQALSPAGSSHLEPNVL